MTTRPTRPVRSPQYPRLQLLAVAVALAGCGGETEPAFQGDIGGPYAAAGGQAATGGGSAAMTYPETAGSLVAPYGGAPPVAITVAEGGSTTSQSATGSGGMGQLSGGAPLPYGGAPAVDATIAIGGGMTTAPAEGGATTAEGGNAPTTTSTVGS